MAILGSANPAAATEVSGTISSDTAWTTEGSPYVITDNTTVAAGVTLTIDPGVVVQSTGRYRLNTVGVLEAVGTAADPISLSVGSGIRFYAGSLGSEIAWATVRDSIDFGITTELNAGQYGPWPSVHDVEFRNNRFAVYPWYPAQGAASVSRARFIGNDYGIAGVGGTMSFDRILVEGTGSHSALLSNNAGQNWSISNSNIQAPSQHAACDANRGCSVYVSGGGYSIDADGLWWGTTDPLLINQRIYDGLDDPSRAVVTKDPISTAPHDLYAPSSAPDVTDGALVSANAGSLSGTASDAATAASGIDQVTVALTDLETGESWNGTDWVAAEEFRVATGTTAWEISIPPLVDGRQYRVRGLGRDAAGNLQWGASSAVFIADGTAPAPPALTDTDPDSPASDNSPRVKGSAEAGSTVRLYTDAACSSAVAGTGSAADFASPGLLVSVADNSSTTFYATATDRAGNPSACSSSSIGYVELTPALPPPDSDGDGVPDSLDGCPTVFASTPNGCPAGEGDVDPPEVSGPASAGAVKVASNGGVTLSTIADCTGPGPHCEVSTSATGAVASKAVRSKQVKLGKSRFQVQAGTKRKVKLRLSRSGLRLLKRLGRIKATVKVRVRRGDAVSSRTIKVKLKAPRTR